MSIGQTDLTKVSALREVVEMHPHWCEWAGRCQDDLGNIEHCGLEVVLTLRSDVDDASVHLALTRYDEIARFAPIASTAASRPSS